MSSAEDIWSSRLQRELLALTSDRNHNESSNTSNKSNLGILPPFITVIDHKFDIIEKTCQVSFAIDVDVDKSAAQEAMMIEDNEVERMQNDAKTDENNDDVGDENNDKDEANDNHNGDAVNNQFVITLDASLQRKLGPNTHDSSISYPFYAPKAYLTTGSHLLPPSSDISNGSLIKIDCDWTPSLHLNDAVLNIALQVRESVRRGELCLKKAEEGDEIETFDTKVSSFFSSFAKRATALVEDVDSQLDAAMRTNHQESDKVITESNVEIGDVIDLSQRPWNEAVGMYPCKAIRRPAFAEDTLKAATEKQSNNKVREDYEDENEIPPWSHNYLQLQSGSIFQVANSGFRGAGSMFRSFSKSAKSLVEESFLILTSELILEIKCTKFSVSSATVTFCIPISELSKLKFRREESISLFFKPAPDDPIIYMCQSSADAVKQIQSVLKKHGVKGRHTNTTMMKAVQVAEEYLNDAKVQEKTLEADPLPERVTLIMDLYRQAAEKFEMAGDQRHEETMVLMREFLAKPLVSGILDGSIRPKQAKIQESVILEPLDETKNDIIHKEEEEDAQYSNDDDNLDQAMQEAEDMLNSAHDELKELGLNDDFEDDADDQVISRSTLQSAPNTSIDKTDVVAEFEDLLKDADKELEQLMGSSFDD